VTQFGKRGLQDAVKAVASTFQGEARYRVDTIAYFARFPTISTIDADVFERHQRRRADAIAAADKPTGST
jgi:hypothetical protein